MLIVEVKVFSTGYGQRMFTCIYDSRTAAALVTKLGLSPII